MGSIVEWQSLKTQEYRYTLLVSIARFWEFFGIRRPVRFEKPAPAGEYDQAVNQEHSTSYLNPYRNGPHEPEPKSDGSQAETGNSHSD